MAEEMMTAPVSEWQSLMKKAEGAATSAKESVLSFGREGPRSTKGILMTLAASGGLVWLLQSRAVRGLEVVKTYWWALGLALVAFGWYLAAKLKNPWGTLFLVAGAGELAAGYRASQEKTVGPDGKRSEGVDETGALYDWQMGPDGRAAFGPKRGNDLADQVAGRVFQTG
jgi:hypothetical protein